MAYIENYHTMKHEGDYQHFYIKDETSRQDALLMGFELEVDTDDDDYDCDENFGCVDEVEGILPKNFVRFEEDGSLNCGFEIITQPASFAYHMNLFNTGIYNQMCHTISNYGLTSHDNGNCGFHIHIDKKYFGKSLDSASAKLLFIFERHWDNLKKFSRRCSDQWCHRYLSGSYSDYHSIKSAINAAKHHYIDRYFAVNLSNSNTIEIRLWRGTLNPATLKATIKLTARLAQIAKETPAVKLATMTWKDILGDDPDILAYARTRGLAD